MSFRPLRVREKRERELEEVPVQDMERPVAGATRGKGLVLEGGCGPASRVGRCLFTDGFPRGVLPIYLEKSIIFSMWRI